MPESVLLQRVKAGDKAAFGQMVDRHIARAYALSLRIMRHREDAEDVVQDAFAAALDRIDSHDAGRPFWPWFSRIIVNRSLDAVRARGRRMTVAIDAAHADPTPGPAETFEQRDLMARFRTCLAELPPRRRLIVELFEIDGLSVAEIADQTGTTRATVRWHLHVSRKALRAALAGILDHADA
jgi:RNA polymerase sigma-70 factor (ECF subfamily)